MTGTAITFETVPPSAGEMAGRIETALRSHAWMVLPDGGGVAGYAYGGTFNRRAAYRWSCEVSVYVEFGRRRTGAGARSTRRSSPAWWSAGFAPRSRA